VPKFSYLLSHTSLLPIHYIFWFLFQHYSDPFTWKGSLHCPFAVFSQICILKNATFPYFKNIPNSFYWMICPVINPLLVDIISKMMLAVLSQQLYCMSETCWSLCLECLCSKLSLNLRISFLKSIVLGECLINSLVHRLQYRCGVMDWKYNFSIRVSELQCLWSWPGQDCSYSEFLHSANNCLNLFVWVYKQIPLKQWFTVFCCHQHLTALCSSVGFFDLNVHILFISIHQRSSKYNITLQQENLLSFKFDYRCRQCTF
jgi:hypothetical protein